MDLFIDCLPCGVLIGRKRESRSERRHRALWYPRGRHLHEIPQDGNPDHPRISLGSLGRLQTRPKNATGQRSNYCRGYKFSNPVPAGHLHSLVNFFFSAPPTASSTPLRSRTTALNFAVLTPNDSHRENTTVDSGRAGVERPRTRPRFDLPVAGRPTRHERPP